MGDSNLLGIAFESPISCALLDSSSDSDRIGGLRGGNGGGWGSAERGGISMDLVE